MLDERDKIYQNVMRLESTSVMLKVILACYTDFEDRVRIIEKTGARRSAYDVVKAYVSGKVGTFTREED